MKYFHQQESSVHYPLYPRPPRSMVKGRALQSVAYTISTSTCRVPRALRPQLSPGLRPYALRATSQHLRQLSLLNQLFNLMYTFSSSPPPPHPLNPLDVSIWKTLRFVLTLRTAVIFFYPSQHTGHIPVLLCLLTLYCTCKINNATFFVCRELKLIVIVKCHILPNTWITPFTVLGLCYFSHQYRILVNNLFFNWISVSK